VADKGLPSCLTVGTVVPSPLIHHPRQKYCARCPTQSPCMRPFSPLRFIVLSPLATHSRTLRSGASSFDVFFCVPGKRDSPDLLMRPTVPKRRNLKKIHQSRLAYSASKITMRTLACDARSRVFSSYMIMVIPTSLCSRLPTLSSSCMFSQFSAFLFPLTQPQVLVTT
jgi:hypothetical protein